MTPLEERTTASYSVEIERRWFRCRLQPANAPNNCLRGFIHVLFNNASYDLVKNLFFPDIFSRCKKQAATRCMKLLAKFVFGERLCRDIVLRVLLCLDPTLLKKKKKKLQNQSVHLFARSFVDSFAGFFVFVMKFHFHANVFDVS